MLNLLPVKMWKILFIFCRSLKCIFMQLAIIIMLLKSFKDKRPKLDVSLVEHTSIMKGAIPVLPIPLAWFCLICNVICPGLGTLFSGMFCLCFGIPRFGIHDSARGRVCSFLINIVIAAGQLFTVLFCLVGWGWSIWWGYIMLKISRKHKKIKQDLKDQEEEDNTPIAVNQNHNDIEQAR